MSTILTQEPKGDFSPAPAGSHVAVCYGVVDLGTQARTFNGETKIAPEILLMFELPNEQMENGQPFSISQRFTCSSHKKSNLRKFLESWRGAPFSDADLGKFDIAVLIGKGCMLGVIHNTANDKTYANITSIMRLPKGTEAPAPHNRMIHFTFDAFDQVVFDGLSQYWRDKIAASPEYKQLKGIGHGPGNDDPPFEMPPASAYADLAF